MRPCQAAPAFDTTMSTPPKVSATLSKAARTDAASVTSQRTASAAPPIALAFAGRAGLVDIEQRDLGAGGGEGLGGGGADGAGGAGDRRDLAGERQFLGGAELRLLERPVFHVEHVGFGDRLRSGRSPRRR